MWKGENMLFACSGITLPHGTTILELTRFVTSACLVREFNEKRNRDDKLRIQVRLPDNTTTDGFMGLYDADIAIVTCIGKLCAHPVDLCLEASPDCPDGHVLAAGRAFSSGGFMAMSGSLSNESPNILLSDGPCFTEAALGGPLVGIDGRFHGMIFDLCHDAGESIKSAKFLSLKSLYDRLELFQILNPKQLHFRGYKLPKGVSSVVPSGFMKTSYRIRSLGYPMPPPLVLELNGKLRNQFEDRFGELRAWKGYPFGDLPNGPRERAWNKLQKEVVTNISRRVVSLASFNRDDTRSFACTGLLISMQRRNSIRTVVLTSASLVRSHDNEDKIDKNLRAGIGGPLIGFDGSFVGMNFYDGSNLTPFLPRDKIINVLANVWEIPSERGYNPWHIDLTEGKEENRWPVPEPYWFHGSLDVDKYDVPELIGRKLD
nr:unnamed protein product [Digitaria exilis]